ncbi:hypothetical protein CGZ75_19890 [Paenibacillus herberti]|uniref:Uncharacterized protein n=1 Tax=Paenibacillus herberti TaxID=1619309 RepID=A0A229NU08_9BACL|nr:hypothetical protein CGZ75_19890 [Paenibacillus herberti]
MNSVKDRTLFIVTSLIMILTGLIYNPLVTRTFVKIKLLGPENADTYLELWGIYSITIGVVLFLWVV